MIKRYEYSETQKFRCIGVTKRFDYLKKRELSPVIKYFKNLFMIRNIFSRGRSLKIDSTRA